MKRFDNFSPAQSELHGLNGISDRTIDTHMKLFHGNENEKR